MKKPWLFYSVLIALVAVLGYYSFVSKDSTMAIVAEVEPRKVAISFPKPVRITSLPVQIGANVNKGDLLLKVTRPDLELDIEKTLNESQQLQEERKALLARRRAKIEIEKLKFEKDQYVLSQRIIQLERSILLDSKIYGSLNSSSTQEVEHQDVQKIESLKEEMKLGEIEYSTRLNQIDLIHRGDLATLDLRNEKLESELNSLYLEKETLEQYSPFNGTIGNIAVQLNELVPPYKTIISIYDDNPNIIRAYMNETLRMSVTSGDSVIVESINRQYQITGEVIEVGSRIVSYPKQMIGMGQQNMWGREIFIQIPEENEFLNGEKVYVILESK